MVSIDESAIDMTGFWELGVLLAILVIVFGARRLPALGESIGRAIVRRRVARRGPARPAGTDPEADRP